MNKKILEALKGSIKKWSNIVKTTTVKDMGGANCPLCVFFNGSFCEGCPVSLETGRPSCKDTPYSEWITHHCQKHDISYGGFGRVRRKNCAECLQLATDELNFLKSLLPKVKK